MTNQDEYKLPNGQSVTIQFNPANTTWEVACWNLDDTAHWYKEFSDQDKAKAEFERWRK